MQSVAHVVPLPSESEVGPQVHTRVQVGYLLGIPIEWQRLATPQLADSPFRRLTPARMIHRRIDVRVKPVLARRSDLPRVAGLCRREVDFDDRLDAFESVLPRNHKAHRRTV